MHMRNRLPVRSTQFSFPMSKYVFALLCCAFNIHPLFAQENLDWRYHGKDLSNQRFQDVDQINPSNVAKLKPAWIFHTGVSDPNMSMEMTPIVVDGVMYVTTGDDDVFALHAATGEQIWAYHPTDMPPLSSLPICCNNDNRGVAVGKGRGRFSTRGSTRPWWPLMQRCRRYSRTAEPGQAAARI
jgi:glucose dehydrogenase